MMVSRGTRREDEPSAFSPALLPDRELESQLRVRRDGAALPDEGCFGFSDVAGLLEEIVMAVTGPLSAIILSRASFSGSASSIRYLVFAVLLYAESLIKLRAVGPSQ
jgi:hypothetical protein